MGAKFFDSHGAIQDVALEGSIYREAAAANTTVAALINQRYQTNSDKYGSAFHQMLASCGLVVPKDNAYGMRAPSIGAILDGTVEFMGAANTSGVGAPAGKESRTLFPIALIELAEANLRRDYETDPAVFDSFVGQNISLTNDRFEQPIVNFDTKKGPQQARAQRIAQLSEPAAMMTFTTSDKTRTIPTYSIGMEFSKQALRATTLDLVGMTLTRYLAVERDAWVYSWISDILNGDNDLNIGALPSVNSSTLDAAATGGKLTHKAWLKFLNRKRRYRRVDAIICDLDTYLAIESREGRPGRDPNDPTLPILDAQARPINTPFGDVRAFIVDSAAEGGPIPANTVLAFDTRYALTKVRNISAEYQAAEEFVMRRSEALRIDFAETLYRTFDDAFDVLVLQ